MGREGLGRNLSFGRRCKRGSGQDRGRFAESGSAGTLRPTENVWWEYALERSGFFGGFLYYFRSDASAEKVRTLHGS